MKIEKSMIKIIKTILSDVLIVFGTWAVTEAIYGPYLVHLNSRSARNQGLPFESHEIISELMSYLIPLIFGIIALFIGTRLNGKWKIVVGLSFIGLGLIHIIPDNPMGLGYVLTGLDLFSCQVNCRIFGLLYLLVGIGIVGLYLKKKQQKKSALP